MSNEKLFVEIHCRNQSSISRGFLENAVESSDSFSFGKFKHFLTIKYTDRIKKAKIAGRSSLYFKHEVQSMARVRRNESAPVDRFLPQLPIALRCCHDDEEHNRP